MPVVIISGAIANKPFNGGAAWTRLNYILGFQKLGFDTYFVEQIQPEDTLRLGYFQQVVREFGLQERATLVCGDKVPRRLVELAGSADLLINISGHLKMEELKSRIPVKAYVDLDPGFTQIWAADGQASSHLSAHDYYFTVGENIGRPVCSIPTGGITWRATRQPIVLDHWPMWPAGEPARFTTISSWRGPFGPVEHEGRTLGSKVRQFRKYAAIPSQIDATFEVALDIHPADYKDREMLSRNGWRIVDPRHVAPTPSCFRRYVRNSGAEFSVAQQIYVETKSGWFSDRSVRYLASGRPVLVEDTGFTRNYPAGEGLLAFSSPEEAVDGAGRILSEYKKHAAAARRIAEEYFDSNRVLKDLLNQMNFHVRS